MTDKQAEEILDQVAARLGEHFEAVQIMVTWQEQGKTNGLKRGVGNWYARMGLAHEMISTDRACDISHELSKIIPQTPPDDSEDWKKE